MFSQRCGLRAKRKQRAKNGELFFTVHLSTTANHTTTLSPDGAGKSWKMSIDRQLGGGWPEIEMTFQTKISSVPRVLSATSPVPCIPTTKLPEFAPILGSAGRFRTIRRIPLDVLGGIPSQPIELSGSFKACRVSLEAAPTKSNPN